MNKFLLVIVAIFISTTLSAQVPSPVFQSPIALPVVVDNTTPTCSSTILSTDFPAATWTGGSMEVANTAGTTWAICRSDGTAWVTMSGTGSITISQDSVYGNPTGSSGAGQSVGLTAPSFFQNYLVGKFPATNAPGSLSGNEPLDIVVDSTHNTVYICGAPAGTSAPACTTVSLTSWIQLATLAGTQTFGGLDTFTGGLSLGAGPSAISEVFTVGTGGVMQYTLVTLNTSNPVQTIAAAGYDAYGIALATVSASGTVQVARYGITYCTADSGGMVAGDRVVPSATVPDCADSGTTTPVMIPITTRIVGQALTSASGGGTFLIELEPDHSGAEVSGGGSTTFTLANAGTTGTTINTLTKSTGGAAVIASTSDTNGVVGVTTSGAGTSGNATITVIGPVSCAFDGATTANDYIQISSTTAGNCHDAGNSGNPPAGVQIIGKVWTTNASAGTYAIELYPASGPPIVAGSGIVPSENAAGVSLAIDPTVVCVVLSNTCIPPITATGASTGSLQSTTLTTAQFSSYVNGQEFILTITDGANHGSDNLTQQSGGPVNLAYVATAGSLPVALTSGLMHQNIPYHMTYSATCNGSGQATPCLIVHLF